MKINLDGRWSSDLIEKAKIVYQEVAELKKLEEKEKLNHQKKIEEEKAKIEQENTAKFELRRKQKQFFEIAYLFSNRIY